MMSLFKFLFGERISKAIVEEWRHGDKITASIVVICATSTPLIGLVQLVLWLIGKVIYG